jgi:septum formation protein
MIDSNRQEESSSRFPDFSSQSAMALILASASPRRQELLRNAGIAFTVQAANIPEVTIVGESPQACAERLAAAKARAIINQGCEDLVLGADTVVLVEREIFGKPRTKADAERMLRLLSGRTHEVITGICLARKSWFEDIRSERTLVSMSAISEDDIREYVATREPMDKAGAYAIQGIASRWIHRIEGDYFNVVGLPVSLVYRMLEEHQAI